MYTTTSEEEEEEEKKGSSEPRPFPSSSFLQQFLGCSASLSLSIFGFLFFLWLMPNRYTSENGGAKALRIETETVYLSGVDIV